MCTGLTLLYNVATFFHYIHLYTYFALRFCGGDCNRQGKVAAAKVFQPYPEDYPKPQPPQYLGANVYGLIHNQQRQNYTMHKLLTSLQPYFARPSTREARTISH